MTFEADLFEVMKAAAPSLQVPTTPPAPEKWRIFPDFAPVDTPRPYVTYQAGGGEVINPLGNEPPGKRNALIQVNVWADTRKSALAISRAIEDAMRAATAFQARPVTAAVGDYDADIPVYGCRQDFTCWHNS